MKRGVSLLELIIVIGLISALSVIGTNSFIGVKNDAEIDAIADELISDIKLARNKSMNGELVESEDASDFSSSGYELPEYGLRIIYDPSNEIYQYKIVRKKCLIDNPDPSTCVIEDLEATTPYTDDFKVRDVGKRYDNKYFILPDGEFFFERITGDTSPITLTVKEKNDNYAREITISNDFIITINEI